MCDLICDVITPFILSDTLILSVIRVKSTHLKTRKKGENMEIKEIYTYISI